jgi:hypothetical protein
LLARAVDRDGLPVLEPLSEDGDRQWSEDTAGPT